MKTLVVKYLPSGKHSNTKKILDLFVNNLPNQNIEELDLLHCDIPIFNEESIQAYYKRNYGGENLDEKEAKLLEKNDQLVKQLKSADILVMAYPMHNFGMPAKVKAWIDAVLINGETFSYDEKKMSGKKALTIYTSGGVYSHDTFNFDYPNWNSIALMSHANFSFMGFDENKIIGTSLRDENKREESLRNCEANIREIIKSWY
ncbi:MAG: NAD(P)H-dependent oxidoreductase [Rickettsiales bacterium]|nr:NAD(P)H-dependent oxidoreductase [Rickettsiales bacterium]